MSIGDAAAALSYDDYLFRSRLETSRSFWVIMIGSSEFEPPAANAVSVETRASSLTKSGSPECAACEGNAVISIDQASVYPGRAMMMISETRVGQRLPVPIPELLLDRPGSFAGIPLPAIQETGNIVKGWTTSWTCV